jgi:hypothetical protein
MEIEVASVKPTGESGQGFGSGPQWGLASLVIGSVIFLASAVLLAFNTIFAHGGRYGVPMGLAWTASMIGWSALLILAGLNVWFGILGWRLARRDDQSIAFGVAGTLMAGAAVLGWLIAGIDLILVLASFS